MDYAAVKAVVSVLFTEERALRPRPAHRDALGDKQFAAADVVKKSTGHE
jgi:hypothetical protein